MNENVVVVRGLQRKGFQHHSWAIGVGRTGRWGIGHHTDYSEPWKEAAEIAMAMGQNSIEMGEDRNERWDPSLRDDAFDWCRKACQSRY